MLDKKAALFEELRSMGINRKVLDAIMQIDRELFVAEDMREEAYSNVPLPIGAGQTISQPYTVAFMVQLLDISKGDKILEIGAGSGYNAAIMARLAGENGQVISIEIIEELCKRAMANLLKAKVANASVVCANGYYGYKEEAPYDKVIATAARDDIPDALVSQLKVGGILVMPVNEGYASIMKRVEKKNGKLTITDHGEFSFVEFREK